jgi:branched-subunit amino acid aminotransferase/4-amino-4-deoxychorismate lyase
MRSLNERDHARRTGLELFRLPEPRGESFLARHKALAWAANAVARRLHPAGHQQRFEGLWLDPAGYVLEGTSTNLFARIDGVYLTPPTSAPILPGVERARLLARLSELGIPYAEAPLHGSDLARADALFATNALLPIAPVIALDGRPLAITTLPDGVMG